MIDQHHKNRKHALLSASGGSKWINCPPSARLEELFSEETSIYAQEGTLAHEIAELELSIKTHIGPVGPGSQKSKWQTKIKKLKKDPLYSPEMDIYVEKYATYVLEEYSSAFKSSKGCVLSLEERVDFSHLVPEGFGIGDVIIINDGTLQIIDLKYGKGVKVEAENNPQLRLYALGALNAYDMLYDIKEVKMTIVQPRLDHISSEVMTVEDLKEWGNLIVRPAAELAYQGKGEAKPGTWCRWCKGKSRCKALALKNLDLEKHQFSPPNLLSDSELIEIYGQMDQLTDWVSSVSSYILDKAKKGKKWEGYKLVEGKSNRKWIDESKTIQLLSKKYERLEFLKEKIRPISEIEALIGKEETNKLLHKPQGAPTLVPESDKRPQLGGQQAKEDFDL